MIASQDIPLILFAGIVALLLSGLVTLTWGRKLPRQGNWLVAVGFVILATALGLGWAAHAEAGFQAKELFRGWVLPRDEVGAITVGIFQDSLGLVMATLTVLASSVLLLVTSLFGSEPRQERGYSAIAISAAGAVLAWLSLTPWLAMVGVGLTIFGGFVALGSRWETEAEAAIATRFGFERSWGMLFAVFGAAILAASRGGLVWGAASGEAWTDTLGAILLAAGLFAQLHPFPLLGWLVEPSETSAPLRNGVAQVLPAWAALAALVRLEPQLRAIGVFPAFGWYALASAVLTVISGLFQSDWRVSLNAWISAGFSMAVGVAAFTSAWAGTNVAIGAGLGGMALAITGWAIEVGGPSGNSTRQKVTWARVSAVLATLAGTGFLGFVSSEGGIRLLADGWNQPGAAAAFGFALFAFVLMGWKAGFGAFYAKNATQASWAVVLMPLFLVILLIAAIWTALVPTMITFGSAHLVAAPLSAIHGPLLRPADENTWNSALAVYGGVALFAGLLGWWTVGRGKEQDSWLSLGKGMPKASEFFAHAYGIDALMGGAAAGLAWLGRKCEWLVDRQLWEEWMPKVFAVTIQRGAGLVNHADLRASASVGTLLRRWVEVPAKLLQLIQNGDVRWYLFFAVGSGLAMMVHFLKF